MTAPELDGFLRGQLAELERLRPGGARPGGLRAGWEAAQASLAAAVADTTGLPEAFVRELLGRRELARQPGYVSCQEATREAADNGFVSAVMAAAAWTAATTAAARRPAKGRT